MREAIAFVLLVGVAAAALAQSAPRPAPPPDPPAAKAHVDRARQLAGTDLPKPLALCDAARVPGASFEQTSKNWLPPTRVFDNLYFVGSQFVGAWIVDGGDGLILFDALGSAADARDRLVPGMKKLGLDPAKIKYVLATHGHWDHYGGAQYLRDTYGARVGLAEPDWKLMETLPAGSPEFRPPGATADVPAPKRDLVLTDGLKLTAGTATVTIFVTPGHSPGTISALVPVRNGSQEVVMSLLGGTAFPTTLEPSPRGGGLIEYARQVRRLSDASLAAGATGIINTHVNNDGGYERLQKLARRKPGEPHPFLIGGFEVARHYGVFESCLKAAAERLRARDPAAAAVPRPAEAGGRSFSSGL